MIHFLITKSCMNYLFKKSHKLGELKNSNDKPAIIIISTCGMGGSCGGDDFFPFEVSKIMSSEAKDYINIEKIDNPTIPDNIELYIGKELLGGFLDTVIIDHAIMGGEDFLFIPPIPKEMHEYDFYSIPSLST